MLTICRLPVETTNEHLSVRPGNVSLSKSTTKKSEHSSIENMRRRQNIRVNKVPIHRFFAGKEQTRPANPVANPSRYAKHKAGKVITL